MFSDRCEEGSRLYSRFSPSMVERLNYVGCCPLSSRLTLPLFDAVELTLSKAKEEIDISRD